MLVLTRKKNEAIVIDGRIVVTIVELRGDKVRVGIEAPKDISINRAEVHAKIQSGESRPWQPPFTKEAT